MCESLYVPLNQVPILSRVIESGDGKLEFAMSTIRIVAWFLSYSLFMYAIVLVAATTMAVFRLSGMLEKIQNSDFD